jgi:hypothetical protein
MKFTFKSLLARGCICASSGNVEKRPDFDANPV